MKNLALFAIILYTSTAFSQTAIISNKSHAGDISQVVTEPDNFGWIEPDPVIDKVILINESCIVLVGTRYHEIKFSDTICDHYALKKGGYSLEACKAYYGEHPKYIGFKDKNNNNDGSQHFWINGSPFKKGTIGFLGLLILSYVAYLFTPVLGKK